MARTTNLETRIEQALAVSLATPLAGVECRTFDNETDDEHSHALIRAEQETEELPGIGVWLVNVMVRLRNLTSEQILRAQEYFRDAATLSASLSLAGAGEFILPQGDNAVTLGSSTRTGNGPDKDHVFSFQITAQPHEVGISV